jgi:predicted nucleic acid-binding protein
VRKAVFDANIYISALITQGGRAKEAWLPALERSVNLMKTKSKNECRITLGKQHLMDDIIFDISIGIQ